MTAFVAPLWLGGSFGFLCAFSVYKFGCVIHKSLSFSFSTGHDRGRGTTALQAVRTGEVEMTVGLERT